MVSVIHPQPAGNTLAGHGWHRTLSTWDLPLDAKPNAIRITHGYPDQVANSNLNPHINANAEAHEHEDAHTNGYAHSHTAGSADPLCAYHPAGTAPVM